MPDNTTPPAFQIRIADYQSDQAKLRQVREAVFIQEQGIPAELEWDEADTHAVHFLVEDSNASAIATARFIGRHKIGRMAVLKTWRRQGIGAALLHYILDYAQQQQIPDIELSAQQRAIDFYLRQGFKTVGEIYLEAGIPHQKMHYSLTNKASSE